MINQYSNEIALYERWLIRKARDKGVVAGRKSLALLEERVANHIKRIDLTYSANTYIADDSSVSYVYVVRMETGQIKIGMAKDPQKRLKGLQTSHPLGLEILMVFKIDYSTYPYYVNEVELDFHEWLDEYRIRGEWFKAEALALIEDKLRTNETTSFNEKAIRGTTPE
jgi:hypothetical protein